ncbi:MAG: hypothetical protein WBA63_09765 [Thermomicrobiales bacterium]
MIVGIIALSLFGIIFAVMALAPLALEESHREAKPVVQPVAIASRRAAAMHDHDHEPQAA